MESLPNPRTRPPSRPADPLDAGDLIAGRRFAYAKAAAEDGDFTVAAEMFEQALERAPNWAPAWFALAEAREKLGDLEAAARAFRMSLTADPDDAQGAGARLALIDRAETSPALPPAYVARLFDGYAPRFDEHLTKGLGYRAPALIAEALAGVAPGRRFASALDLGCGTGLMGAELRRLADRLTGLDLSPAMIAKARKRGLYEELIVGDAAAILEREPAAACNLIVAADMLVYVGDLAPLFAAVARALVGDGIFAFSAESRAGEGFRLEPTMRFAHSRSYIETTARAGGLTPLLVQPASTRREAGADAPGLICLFEKP